MKRIYIAILFIFNSSLLLVAQLTPDVTSWIINTTGATGYNGIPSNVQQVQYSANNVYVSATCIPGYDIGPWPNNPNTPVNKNFVFKITRHPVQNTGNLINTPLGHIGVWSNGVSIFNPKDGMSYNNAGVWNRNALFFEGISFDECLGHPAPGGEYHHHVNPRCLYDDTDSTHHSPIIGYAFDGFPVYGAYANAHTDGTGAITRMRSSFVPASTMTRTNGPAVDATYPIGAFIEDYVYIAGSGDLDIHNGRFCITPEYPAGTYAYFVTLDETLYPVYPFVIGPQYYGTVQPGNTGPNSGHVNISESVITYNPATRIADIEPEIDLEYYPNPATNYLTMYVSPGENNNLHVRIHNAMGETMIDQHNIQPAVPYTFDLRPLPPGAYYLIVESNHKRSVKKLLIIS